jgi:hypothetical protein
LELDCGAIEERLKEIDPLFPLLPVQNNIFYNFLRATNYAHHPCMYLMNWIGGWGKYLYQKLGRKCRSFALPEMLFLAYLYRQKGLFIPKLLKVWGKIFIHLFQGVLLIFQ